ncbi:penicillin-binding protein, 1A family [Pleurocapsa sp. PCC 7327]|uniref:PBP1A family penicillin-binding protein n=1 Tax=Pleurocapsa sp. PCC 7327 TaxID=118163 RepID=UPI00029FC693|nr:PBP1A family penicillin-binding protein [Pleurocapsa sp. PCC 7327]AFY76267.1 penicillin-binding protein, 1A family [Pleurocapsa sp. PCC 7327]
MTKNPPPQSQTQLSRMLTQAVQKIQAKVRTGVLKKGAKVPELWIWDGNADKPEKLPLVGDRYTLGRSSRASDIVVRNPIVSHVHCSLHRDRKNPRSFILKDEQSTNGIYLGRRKLRSHSLYHGDRISLGPPELAAAVQIKYYNPPPIWVKGFRYFLYGTGGICGVLALWIGIEWTKIPVRPLPSGITGPVVIYAGDEQTPLSPVQQNTHRELENLSDFSPYLPKAVIASEDSRYYWHIGIDPYGILRAAIVNLRGQGIRQGASTLTQQLARSLFSEVGRENTAGRKLREMVVALKLEAVYSKNELLKTYLNRVYLGAGSYGFEDAARFYFEKSAQDLTLAEAATLVAMLPAPNSYNPVQNYDTALQLRNRVISRMASLGMVSAEEADRARRSRIEVSPKATEALSSIIAPYYYSYVFEELRMLLGEELAKEGNFIVETALDLDMQADAEKALRNAVNANGASLNYSQGAIVTIDTRTGAVLALTGGVNYKESQFNRATQAQRQPGSTFKVFAYAAALEQGISPQKTYSCDAVSWQGQRFKPCERSSGDIDMYRALAQSENAVALRVAREVGLDRVEEMARRLGIKSKLNPVPGLVLGQSEVNVLEITGAYATFANRGVWNRPHAIKRILDGSDCKDADDLDTCREIYAFEKDNTASRQAIAPAVADTMTDLLRGVVRGGTGKAARIGLGEVGKTGTTNDSVDLWFIGYVPRRDLVTGVWLGNDNNSPTQGSSAQAAALWGDYMREVAQ